MNNDIIVTIGKDVAAYAKVRVPQGTDLNNTTLREIVYEADRNEVFTPNWENSNGLRIVCVSGSENSEDNNICDIQVESGRLDLGMEADLFLKGVISLDQFVSNAISLRAIKEDEVNLQPIDVYAEIVDGTIGSVKTKSKNFNGNLVQIDHDCPDDADYEFDGMEVSVFHHTIEKAVGSMNLLPMTGTIERMLLDLKNNVETVGLSKVVESCESFDNASEDSDAQGFIEAISFYLTQAVAYDLSASQAAEFVIGKVLGNETPENLNKYQIVCETGEQCSKVANLGVCFSLFSTWIGNGYYYYIVNVETKNNVFVRSPFDGEVRKATVI